MFDFLKQKGTEFLLGKETKETIEELKKAIGFDSGKSNTTNEFSEFLKENKEDLLLVAKHSSIIINRLKEKAKAKAEAREEAENKAREEAENKAREEAENKAREEAELERVVTSSASDTTKPTSNENIEDYSSLSNIVLLQIIFVNKDKKVDFIGKVKDSHYEAISKTINIFEHNYDDNILTIKF